MEDGWVEILSIGHSTLSYTCFLDLLHRHGVTAIADVRTAPHSRHSPQFNKDSLREALKQAGIAYVFLGRELGGRPKGEQFFRNGVADYEKMAAGEQFAKGLARVIEGAKRYRIAMMCAEQDPLDCHRCLLVGRGLHELGVAVRHILPNGVVIDQAEIEQRLITASGRAEKDLFESPDQRRASAYRAQASRVAYSENRTHSRNAAPGR